jgi:hypothetical protein
VLLPGLSKKSADFQHRGTLWNRENFPPISADTGAKNHTIQILRSVLVIVGAGKTAHVEQAAPCSTPQSPFS